MNEAFDLTLLQKTLERIERKIVLQAVEPGEWVMPSVITARYGLTKQTLRGYQRTIWPEGVYWQKNKKGLIVFNEKAIAKWMSTPYEEK